MPEIEPLGVCARGELVFETGADRPRNAEPKREKEAEGQKTSEISIAKEIQKEALADQKSMFCRALHKPQNTKYKTQNTKHKKIQLQDQKKTPT